jgi:hypothetical protein
VVVACALGEGVESVGTVKLFPQTVDLVLEGRNDGAIACIAWRSRLNCPLLLLELDGLLGDILSQLKNHRFLLLQRSHGIFKLLLNVSLALEKFVTFGEFRLSRS